MKVYLVTHVHTEQLPGEAVDAWRLSKRGQEQAAMLAEAPLWSQVDRVVLSAEPKTWLSVAGAVQAHNLPVWVDCRFDEIRRSGWIDDYDRQVAEVFAAPMQSVGGWEAADSVRARLRLGLADVARRFAGETLALVGHGICLSLMRADIMGDSLVDFSAWQRLSFGVYAEIALDPPMLLTDFVLSADRVR